VVDLYIAYISRTDLRRSVAGGSCDGAGRVYDDYDGSEHLYSTSGEHGHCSACK
jgi:hypothetical protein